MNYNYAILPTNIKSQGYVKVASGGLVQNLKLTNDAKLIVSSGGSAKNIYLEKQASAQILSGGVASICEALWKTESTILSSGGAIVSSINGGIAIGNEQSGTIFRGIKVHTDTVIESGVSICTWNDAYCKNLTIATGGNATFIGGSCGNLRISGSPNILSGQITADRTYIDPKGYHLIIGSINGLILKTDVLRLAGDYLEIQWMPYPVRHLETQATVTITNTSIGNAFISGYRTPTTRIMRLGSMGRLSKARIETYGYLRISSGGSCNILNIHESGTVDNQAGMVNQVTLEANSGTYEGHVRRAQYSAFYGYTNNININKPNSYLHLYGSSYTTYLNMSGGFCMLESSAKILGSATIEGHTSNLGHVYCQGDAKISNVTVKNNGCLHIQRGGSINNLTISSGGKAGAGLIGGVVQGLHPEGLGITDHQDIYQSRGGTVTTGFIKQGGFLYLTDKGIASKLTISSGGFFRVAGGTANSVTVSSGGTLYIDQGASISNIVSKTGAIISYY